MAGGRFSALETELAVTKVTVHLTLGECRRPAVVETPLPKSHSEALSSLENGPALAVLLAGLTAEVFRLLDSCYLVLTTSN